MNTARKKLYVHAGGLKTGSTALQIYLQKNQTVLEECGIAYKHVPKIQREDQFTTLLGNGNLLVNAITGQNDESLRKTVVSYFGRFDAALCSTEKFSHLSYEQWTRFRDVCADLEIEPVIIYFVRNIGPYLCSIYAHCVKFHGEFLPFGPFIESGKFKELVELNVGAVKNIHAAFTTERIRILHYETELSRMGAALVSQLNLDVSKFSTHRVDQPVNRSLADFELSIARRANQYYTNVERSAAEYLSNSLAFTLIYNRPGLRRRHTIPNQLRNVITDRYQADVDWINRSFFDRRQQVSIFDQDDMTASGAGITEAEKVEVLEDAFIWAVRELTTYLRNGKDLLLEVRLQEAKDIAVQYVRPKVGIPKDFDPITYLLLNPDLFVARVDPYEHYLGWGKSEARRYSWEQL